MRAGRGFIDPALVQTLAEDAPQRIRDLLPDEAETLIALAAASIALAVTAVWGRMTFQRSWREWLTHQLLDLWLVHDNYRLLDGGPGEPQLAEYRIAEDARIATDAPIDLLVGLLSSVLTAATFVVVLWTVGGGLAFIAVALVLALLVGRRINRSILALSSAAKAFGVDTDVRLVNLVNSSIARTLHIKGLDLEEVCALYEASLMHAVERDDRRIAADILQNLGTAYTDRGCYKKAGEFYVIGTALMLDYGYTEGFRRLTKSSFAGLGRCLLELGALEAAHSVRVMIDRLGPETFFSLVVPHFKVLEAATYTTPAAMELDIASEEEFTAVLRKCHAALQAIDVTVEVLPLRVFTKLDVGRMFA